LQSEEDLHEEQSLQLSADEAVFADKKLTPKMVSMLAIANIVFFIIYSLFIFLMFMRCEF
jgi:hypothetical protein